VNSWVIERTVVEHHITVPRTARYHALGDAATASEIWIVLHGYGHLARYFLRKFEGLEEGRLIVAPEGLSRFYLDDGHTRVGATWMTREDRELEIADQLTYLDQLTEHLRAGSRADIRLNVLGFSQGVATACRWAAIGRTASHAWCCGAERCLRISTRTPCPPGSALVAWMWFRVPWTRWSLPSRSKARRAGARLA